MKGRILKNINKKNSTWRVKLIKNQEITLFLYCATKCPTEAEKIDFAKNELIIDSGGQKMKPNTTEFHSCTITANIWQNNEK